MTPSPEDLAFARFRRTGAPVHSGRELERVPGRGLSGPGALRSSARCGRARRRKPRTLDLDARRFAPGRIEGRILLDGRPLPFTRWFSSADGKDPLQPGGITDSEGHFTLDPALPGQHWIVVLWTLASGTQRRLIARKPIQVDPGERVQATADLDSAKAEGPTPPASWR